MTAKLDASAIIYLAKADLLELSAEVWEELSITTDVYQEAVVRGREAGFSDAEVIARAIQDRVVGVVSLDEDSYKRLESAGFPPRLGTGEQTTIIEALEQECLAVLDDLRARSAAAVLGAELSRTETLLLEALVKGLVDFPEYETALLRLAQVRTMKPADLVELLRLGRLITEVLTDEYTDT